MKFTGTIASELSGSLGGITASRNRGGGYFRQRVIPVNPNTGKQAVVRTIVQFLSDYWANGLTVAQRTAWTNWAEATPGFVGVGIDAFQYANLPRQYLGSILGPPGIDLIEEAPVSFDVGGFVPVTFTASGATNNFAIVFDNGDTWANTDDAFLLVYGGTPINVSRTSFQGRYNMTTPIFGDGTTPPTSPATIPSPFPLTAGQRVFIKVRSSLPDGRNAFAQRLSTIVT